MSVLGRLKRVTPKQWAMVVVGAGGTALLVDYFRSKDNSLVAKLWRQVRGGGALPAAKSVLRAPTDTQLALPSSAVLVEQTIPPEVYAPMYGGVPYFARYFPSPHGGGGSGHHHHAGAPEGIKGNVPPPGSRGGIVSVTPPAPTDPGQGGTVAAPCGPGLYFEPQTGRCVPYPTTPPTAPYGWE